jgi:hypothetical protein
MTNIQKKHWPTNLTNKLNQKTNKKDKPTNKQASKQTTTTTNNKTINTRTKHDKQTVNKTNSKQINKQTNKLTNTLKQGNEQVYNCCLHSACSCPFLAASKQPIHTQIHECLNRFAHCLALLRMLRCPWTIWCNCVDMMRVPKPSPQCRHWSPWHACVTFRCWSTWHSCKLKFATWVSF